MHEQLWERPIPNIGDTSSAGQRGEDPTSWAFDAGTQRALASVIGARRDIRKFRSEPVPNALVDQVLAAGHAGPSVGHSQPWRFLVVSDPNTQTTAANMADKERLRQAELLSPDRRKMLLDLQLEGIRTAPVGIIVACDRRTPSSGVLGRNTFCDADMWSCAAAIENMWLTARSLGLGMGWVTLFEPAELAELLGLPEGVETLGWLCLGWPDELPPSPGLERRGWSKRLPLSEVIFAERWPDSDTPSPPSALGSSVSAPTHSAVVSARDEADALLTPPGSLGRLDDTLDRVTAVVPTGVESAELVCVATDHPVAKLGVTAFSQSVTGEVTRAAIAGQSLGAATASAMGFGCEVVDAGVLGGPLDGAKVVQGVEQPGDLVSGPAMSIADAHRLIACGREIGAESGSGKLICLGEIGMGNTTVAAALACALLGLPVVDAVGLGSSGDTAMVERKRDVIESALTRHHAAASASHTEAASPTRGLAAAGPVETLASLGGPEIAVLTGVILGAAEAGSVVVLDGLATSVAAVIACRINAAAQSWLVASHVSREPAHGPVLTDIGLEPLLDLRLRAGEGVGACYGAQMILAGLAARDATGKTS